MAVVYLDAAAVAANLIASPQVAARWNEPSALSEMAVGSLAGHLARQITGVPARLADQQLPDKAELLTVPEHYARVRWAGAALDDEANVSIRRDSDDEAAGGPDDLARRTRTAVAQLRDALPAEQGGRAIYLPWTGWALTLEDFLTTRLLEIVVHVDDLAVSVDVVPPNLPEQATDTVLALLAQLAARRHGPAAVLRALTRQERAPATITAF
jgi:Mycothiol maleylpyruvate isomerase N-terminal domain